MHVQLYRGGEVGVTLCMFSYIVGVRWGSHYACMFSYIVRGEVGVTLCMFS